MGKYKKYIGLIILVVILIFLYSTFKKDDEGTTRGEPQATEQGLITPPTENNLNIQPQEQDYINIPEKGQYSSTMTNLSFTYPTDWNIVLDNTDLTSIISPDNQDAINIGIISPKTENIEDFSSNLNNKITTKFPDSTPEFQEIDINGKKVYSAVYDYDVNDETIYETILYYPDDNGNLVVISYATKNENSDYLEQIISTITF